MEVATRRADPSTRDAEPFLPDQRLPLHVALAAFTKGSAHVNRDDDAGSLEEGYRADLVVLDRNLFAASDAAVADARVEHTIAAGRVVHSAGSITEALSVAGIEASGQTPGSRNDRGGCDAGERRPEGQRAGLG